MVGTVINAATTAAVTAVVTSTTPAAVRRCQPVRRFRASTNGFNANANSDAIASAERGPGIERVNTPVIGRSATGMGGGSGEGGSRSNPSDPDPAVGTGSGAVVGGPRGGVAPSVSYEPMVDVARTLR